MAEPKRRYLVPGYQVTLQWRINNFPDRELPMYYFAIFRIKLKKIGESNIVKFLTCTPPNLGLIFFIFM